MLGYPPTPPPPSRGTPAADRPPPKVFAHGWGSIFEQAAPLVRSQMKKCTASCTAFKMRPTMGLHYVVPATAAMGSCSIVRIVHLQALGT